MTGVVGAAFVWHLARGDDAAQAVRFVSRIIDADSTGDCKAVADLDGDHRPDLIVAGAELSWYRNPTFQKEVIATAEDQFSTDMAVGDIDADGDVDIVVPDGPSGVYWFENPRPEHPVSSGWSRHRVGNGDPSKFDHDVEVGDIDADHRLDIVTRPKGSRAYVFFQDTSTSWTMRTLELGTGGEGLAIADVSGDGALDIVVEERFLLSPADPRRGAFAPLVYAKEWHDLPAKVAVADVSDDGRPDVILTPAEDEYQVAWFEAPRTFSMNAAWSRHVIRRWDEKLHSLAVGDVDLDGHADIVTAAMHTAPSGGATEVLFHRPSRWLEWERSTISPEPSHNLVLADVDLDGDLDVFGGSFIGTPPVRLLTNHLPMARHFSYTEVARGAPLSFGLVFADLDHDGRTDILTGDRWYTQPDVTDAPIWSEHRTLPAGMHVALSLDVDGDTRVDLIAQRVVDDSLEVYWLEDRPGAGEMWSKRVAVLPSGGHILGSQGLRIADLDGDGRTEVLVATTQGLYALDVPTSSQSDPRPVRMLCDTDSDEGFAVGDVDADGRLDVILSRGSRGNQMVWCRNPGDGTAPWSSLAIDELPSGRIDRVEAADLDGDGRLDVIATQENRKPDGAGTFWWRQHGESDRIRWERAVVTVQASTHSLEAVDLDGDGDVDLLVAEHGGANRLTMFANDGRGQFDGEVIDSGKDSHLGARAVDIDGDGDLDIASISFDDPQLVHLWRNLGVVPEHRATH